MNSYTIDLWALSTETRSDRFPTDRLIIRAAGDRESCKVQGVGPCRGSRWSLEVALGTQFSKLKDLCSPVMEFAPESSILITDRPTKLCHCLDIGCPEKFPGSSTMLIFVVLRELEIILLSQSFIRELPEAT